MWPSKLFSAALLLPLKIDNLKEKSTNSMKLCENLALKIDSFLKNAALGLIWVGRR
jgi:hypothetical protein